MKAKYQLDSNMIKIEKDKLETKIIEDSTNSQNFSKTTIAINSDLKADMKVWCAKNKITLAQALIQGFLLLKEKK